MQGYKNVERVKPSGLELVDKLVGVQRVTKVTKGGRAFGFSAIVVVGDGNGVVGHGLGKSKDVASAIAKAIEDAKKNLVRIPILNGTLPHEQKGKFGGAKIFIKPASAGTGVIAGGAVRTVIEVAGIKNIIAKQLGSNNLLNNARATICAFKNLTTASQVAKKRDLTLESLG